MTGDAGDVVREPWETGDACPSCDSAEVVCTVAGDGHRSFVCVACGDEWDDLDLPPAPGTHERELWDHIQRVNELIFLGR